MANALLSVLKRKLQDRIVAVDQNGKFYRIVFSFLLECFLCVWGHYARVKILLHFCFIVSRICFFTLMVIIVTYKVP